MAPPRTWLAIPFVALACALLALVIGELPVTAFAIGALAAACAAAVRGFAGTSLAAAVSAIAAGLLVALAVLDLPATDPRWLARVAVAAAAALFAIAELARPLPVDGSPLPAIGASLLAGALDPSYVALLAIAGMRLLLGPWTRPRWAAVVPIAGMLAIGIALLAACAEGGPFAELWRAWAARNGPEAPLELFTRIADTLGPIATIAALAGLAVCALRGRYAAAATLAVIGCALAVDLACGVLGTATLAIAAVTAGVGLARLAATVRWPTGQAFVGATAGVLIVVAPAMLRW